LDDKDGAIQELGKVRGKKNNVDYDLNAIVQILEGTYKFDEAHTDWTGFFNHPEVSALTGGTKNYLTNMVHQGANPQHYPQVVAPQFPPPIPPASLMAPPAPIVEEAL